MIDNEQVAPLNPWNTIDGPEFKSVGSRETVERESNTSNQSRNWGSRENYRRNDGRGRNRGSRYRRNRYGNGEFTDERYIRGTRRGFGNNEYRRGGYNDDFDSVTSRRLFAQLLEDFPKLDKRKIRPIETSVKLVDEKYREVIIKNLCCKAEALEYYYEDKELQYVSGINLQECGLFELEIHKEFINKYKILKCQSHKHNTECFGFHDIAKDRRRKPLMYPGSN